MSLPDDCDVIPTEAEEGPSPFTFKSKDRKRNSFQSRTCICAGIRDLDPSGRPDVLARPFVETCINCRLIAAGFRKTSVIPRRQNTKGQKDLLIAYQTVIPRIGNGMLASRGSRRPKDLTDDSSDRSVRHGAELGSTRTDGRAALPLWTHSCDRLDWRDESDAL